MINAYQTSRRKTAAALKGHQAHVIEMVNRKDAVHLQREPTVAQSDRAREARLATPSYRSLDEELGAEVCAELAEMEHRVLHTTSGLYSVQLTGGAKGFLLEKANGLSDEGHKIKTVIEHYLIRPLTNLRFTGQIRPEALVLVDWRADKQYLTFARTPTDKTSAPVYP